MGISAVYGVDYIKYKNTFVRYIFFLQNGARFGMIIEYKRNL